MKTIAFFNNKGGVGKTSLVYHLAWMLAEMEYRVLAADLDPQANLSSMFLDEGRLEELWEGANGHTIDEDIDPLFEGTGDIRAQPYYEKMGERICLLVGDLTISKREDELSTQWIKSADGDGRAFRVMSAFFRLIDSAAQSFGADIALIDVGPNLGAINRAALIASDHVVIPLAPDLFSLQGLKNVGPTLDDWREDWQRRIAQKPGNLNIALPAGKMEPVGYIIMRHSVLRDRPVKAYDKWIRQVPSTYKKSVLKTNAACQKSGGADDEHCLAHLKDYRSLMPLAQDARKPMFMLKSAEGAIGAQLSAVARCYADFKILAKKIIDVCDISSGKSDRRPPKDAQGAS